MGKRGDICVREADITDDTIRGIKRIIPEFIKLYQVPLRGHHHSGNTRWRKAAGVPSVCKYRNPPPLKVGGNSVDVIRRPETHSAYTLSRHDTITSCALKI